MGDQGEDGWSALGLEPYQWQIAGHRVSKVGEKRYVGLLRDKKTRHLLKPLQAPPRGECELQVYERIWDETSTASDPLQSLRPFAPRYFGKRILAENGKSISYMELEDATADMVKPCVADIKIGARTWDPNASPEKIQTDGTKYAPYAERLCFRFLGMMIYQHDRSAYEMRDKNWGKTVTDTDVPKVFADYFRPSGDRQLAVVNGVLEKLRSIEQCFSKPFGSAIYSSSLLLAYDADPGHNRSASIDVRMIDFTHVFKHDGCDTNYLNGVKSLIRHIESHKAGLKTGHAE